MNSESPLRVSSTAVTAACIVCGIFVASLLVKKLAPTAPSFLHFGGDTKATAANQSLQEKLAEFQRDAHRGGSQHAAVTLPETGRESKTHSSIAERRSPRPTWSRGPISWREVWSLRVWSLVVVWVLPSIGRWKWSLPFSPC